MILRKLTMAVLNKIEEGCLSINNTLAIKPIKKLVQFIGRVFLLNLFYKDYFPSAAFLASLFNFKFSQIVPPIQ